MKRYFFIPDLLDGLEEIVLPQEESHHILKVLRAKMGTNFYVLDGQGHIASCELIDNPHSRKLALCKVLKIETFTSATPQITLMIAAPKGKTMLGIIRQATELGISAIQPIICEFSENRNRDIPKNWEQQLLEACKQSGNPFLPIIHAPLSIKEAFQKYKNAENIVATVPNQYKKDWQQGSISGAYLNLWIGPEGGFTDQEHDAMIAQNFRAISLGQWILRVETAVVACLGAIYGKTS
ncbi:MAG: 16S rRNA (uracil(1498)-N(3))-methyltransferase [Lentisphaeria bacterium]|nr:16S rRNA (uracil(1498)-N(3))-methyltransferase [Lentisphaeria bacterium]